MKQYLDRSNYAWLGAAGLVASAAAMCVQQMTKAQALEALWRGATCGAAIDHPFAFGQCSHCYAVAAGVLIVATAWLARRSVQAPLARGELSL